jgi:hypothetical protein
MSNASEKGKGKFIEVIDFESVPFIDIKRKYRLLKVCVCPLLAPHFKLFSFFAVGANSTNEANKARSMRH